jgi:hypothetical protein
MDLLSTVATAILMVMEEEAQERAAFNSLYSNQIANPTSEWNAVDKENLSPTQHAQAQGTPEGKLHSLPAAYSFENNTPNSHSSSGASHVIEYNESSAEDDMEMDTDTSFVGENKDPHQGIAVHLDLSGVSFDPKCPYWMQKDWIPTIQVRNQKGKIVAEQKPPNEIRQELIRYLKLQKKTKTALLLDLGVNSNSFRKFMDASNYKDPWRAGT